jgi:hypothetical protein
MHKKKHKNAPNESYCTLYSIQCTVDRDLLRKVTLPEVEFLEEIQTEVLRVFLLAIHRHLYQLIVLPIFCFLDLRFLQATAGKGGGVSGLINTLINEE